MAHLEKFKKSGLGQLMAHVRRGTTEEIKDRHYSNENIDSSRSKLNVNLHDRRDGISDYNYIVNRCELHNVLNRKDVNYLGGWVITLPENMKNLNKEEQERFFREATKFLEDRYTFDNIAYAYVHWDETTPHLHAGVTPCFYDKKKERFKCSFKEFFTKRDYQTFHKDLSDHMEKVFGYDVGVYDKTEGKKASNKSIKELKQEAHRKEAEIEELKKQVVLKEREASAHKKDAEMWKEIADKESQQALYSKQEADRQNSRIEKAKEVSGKLSLSQKSGLKAIERGMLDDEIQAEIERRVELKMAGKKRESLEKSRELNQLREKTGQQEREIISYKNRILAQNKELEELRQNDNSEVISSLIEKNNALKKENSLLRKTLGRLVYEMVRVSKDIVNDAVRWLSSKQRKQMKECFEETKQHMKEKYKEER